jgi:hypothetical protein
MDFGFLQRILGPIPYGPVHSELANLNIILFSKLAKDILSVGKLNAF